MSIKITWVAVISFFVIVAILSVSRDINANKQNPCDLRNRVVGARLTKDGRSPYFYKWKPEDGIRYYDPSNFDTLQVSVMTATPFFHHLMEPLAGLPEHEISKWWLLLEYIMFSLITWIAFSAATKALCKWAVLVAAAGFLLTEAWQMHIYVGQYYLCISFLATLFYFVVSKKENMFLALTAGVFAAALILIKPTAVFFFLPFLLVIKNYSRRYLLVLLTPLLGFFIFFIFSKNEQFLWRDYRGHIAEQVKLHQGLHPALRKKTADPDFASWEGINKEEIKNEEREHPVILHSENGNVFVIINTFFHIKLPLIALGVFLAVCLFAVGGLFYLYSRSNGPVPVAVAAIMGFCLYMITDLFSPVWRHQYYTVQWIFPVLLAAAIFKPVFKWPCLLMWAGLVLNCLNITFIKMEHSIGEYFLLISLIALVLTRKTEKAL